MQPTWRHDDDRRRSCPGLFHAWEKQIIAGIGWELVKSAVELDSGTMPDFSVSPQRHSEHQVRINGQLYAALAEEACLEAGVAVCYYEMPQTVATTGGGWLVKTAGKGMSRRIACRQLIDCTGGADIVGMIGLPRLREAATQPGTLMFSFAGYDKNQLDSELIQQRYREALANGRLHEGDYCHANGQFVNFLRSGGGNAQHIFGADSSTSSTKTQANIAGRTSVLRLLRFIRSLPGCQDARLTTMRQETAVRETYRIVGEVQITHDDYVGGRRFYDAVSYSFYPIDLHDKDGVTPKPLGAAPCQPCLCVRWCPRVVAIYWSPAAASAATAWRTPHCEFKPHAWVWAKRLVPSRRSPRSGRRPR